MKYFYAVCCLSTIIFVLYLECTGGRFYRAEHILQYNATTTKVILLWNAFFRDPRWSLPQDTVMFVINDENKCIFTNNRNILPRVDKFNAIIFHTAEQFWRIPHVRDVRQNYIFANKESPPHTWHNLRKEKGFYNLTMTYRLDSDIVWPYNQLRDEETNKLIAPAKTPAWRSPNLSEFVPSANLTKLINGKTKSVAWFVSNCHTISKREKLMASLQKHLEVDIFGHCGKLSCPFETKECNDILDKQYKFYLSFENSLCVDYVTEKLFNALQRTVIPIVYGGADYNRFAPPHSYIDVQDFKNIADLVDYLKYLERNTTAYGEYFWWKDYYKIGYYDLKFPIIFQDLCAYLHSTTANQVQIYKNIEEHWLRACDSNVRIKF